MNPYFLVVTISPIKNELIAIKNASFLDKVKDYDVIDVSAFIPEYYYGTNKVEENIKEIVDSKDEVILSAFNRGYRYLNDNYDPYSGNSFLVSPNYFNKIEVRDSKKNIIKFDDILDKSKITIIIPNKAKQYSEELTKKYVEWASFISDVSVAELNVTIKYSDNNQDLYSFGFQDNISELVLHDPVILVVNPELLNAEQTVSLISSRFLIFQKLSKVISTNKDKKYFQEINKIGYVEKKYKDVLTFNFVFLTLLITLVFSNLIVRRIERLYIIDTLIIDLIVVLGINLFLPFNKFTFFTYILIIILTYINLAKSLFKMKTKKLD